MFSVAFLVIINFVVSVSSEFSTSLSIFNGGSWIVTRSKIVYLGQPLRLRCTATGPDNITINRKDYDKNVTTELVAKFGTEVSWEVTETEFSDSGVYECVSRGLSDIVTVYIYSIIATNDVIVPTIEYIDKIGSFNFTRRHLDTSAFLDTDRNWMSCTCVVGSVKLLDIITVTWEGGLFDDTSVNQSQIHQIYSKTTIRDPSIRAVTARLRLNLPLLDQRVFGQYRCVFSFSKSEHAVATVHLKVPPILRLVHDPPPIPPTNSSGRYTCTSSLCTTPIPEEHSNSNWTNACEILVAYPLVKSKNLIWAWTQPQWAAYIIRKVEEVGKANVLSDFSMLNDNEIGSYGPWEVLERRRRSTSTDSDMEKPDLVKSGPILFWCWANNDVGQTTIWWPGPVDSYSYSIWSSVWWPLLGVTLELLSLAVVFIFFRYCRRQRLRYGVGNTPETGGSFGRSRLLDTDADGDQVEMKATNTSSSSSTSVIGLHTHGPIPYIRLSNQNKHSNNSNNNNSNGNNNNSFLTKITGINHSSTDGYMNPNLIQDPVDAEVEAMASVQNLHNERELIDDDYFWDSDTGGNNVDDNTTTRTRNNHQTVA
ncbi:unnamed protein product [Trichobilharzia szidati]|nr:unnamed protein product [Trichobilharzia szidati]